MRKGLLQGYPAAAEATATVGAIGRPTFYTFIGEFGDTAVLGTNGTNNTDHSDDSVWQVSHVGAGNAGFRFTRGGLYLPIQRGGWTEITGYCVFAGQAQPADYAVIGLSQSFPCTFDHNNPIYGVSQDLVVFVQSSRKPGYANVCMAWAYNISGGVCFRTDQSGNLDPTTIPWVQE